MIDVTQEVQPLTALRDHPAEFIEHVVKSRRPVTLAVDAETQIVVQEATAYQRLLDLAAEADEREGVRQGDEDCAAGRTQTVREVFDEIRREYGLSR